MTTLQKQLFELQDLKYRDFHAKLLPGIDKETIIGIRTPILVQIQLNQFYRIHLLMLASLFFLLYTFCDLFNDLPEQIIFHRMYMRF